MIDLSSPTSQTLLAKLRTNTPDETAWDEFVNLYGKRIYSWCRGRGLQAVDAEDVTQNVLVRLTKVMLRFEYDSSMSFRCWLRTVVQNLVNDFLRDRVRSTGDGKVACMMSRLEEAEATQDLLSRLDDLFDLELLEEAKARVRIRVSNARWKAWSLMAEKNLPAIEVSRMIGMKVETVFTARGQIQEMIRNEVSLLER